MDSLRSQRCFSIEIERDTGLAIPPHLHCLANFKVEFVILITKGSYRYSLAEDKWEVLPTIETAMMI